ncbi:MAG: amidohydrolase [Lachnospiraceae bacterium]|nr:amidohydrolase [Lachnospiraceae bacterium]
MDIRKRVEEIEGELIAMRRDFHRHPENSWEEVRTQQKIIERLEMLGIPCCKAAKTGVLATIKGSHASGPVIGLRADIDALAVSEESGVDFCSEEEGCMHACGHDTHISILLAAAEILNEMKEELNVTVRLIFQPAEEYIADCGAPYMNREPLVQECERLVALHIWSKLESGYASLRYGPVMAAADTFDLWIKGQGGHGALPHQTIDPVVAGAELVNALQKVVSREVDPLDPAVISITSFQAGTSANVIPDSAHLMGTARTFNTELRERFPEMIDRIAQGVAASTRTEIRLDYHRGPRPTINDRACTDTGLRAAKEVFGEDHLVEFPLQMSGEDFSLYDNPKCLMLLGGGDPDESLRYAQHNPHFIIREEALKLGVEYFVRYVAEYSKEHAPEGK